MTSVLTFIRTATHFFLVLTSLELKRQIRSYTPIAPLKAIPDSRPKWAKSIPVFRPKRPKTLSLGAAHTYMAYIREYSPSPDVAGHLILDLVDLSQNYQSKPDDFDHWKNVQIENQKTALQEENLVHLCTCKQLFDHCTTQFLLY